jgi:hypothetical protein
MGGRDLMPTCQSRKPASLRAIFANVAGALRSLEFAIGLGGRGVSERPRGAEASAVLTGTTNVCRARRRATEVRSIVVTVHSPIVSPAITRWICVSNFITTTALSPVSATPTATGSCVVSTTGSAVMTVSVAGDRLPRVNNGLFLSALRSGGSGVAFGSSVPTCSRCSGWLRSCVGSGTCGT